MKVRVTTDRFTSGGKPITLDGYEPDEPGQYPAVILLHGAEGMAFAGFGYRQAAQALAENGYAVFQPHYFERTGTTNTDVVTIMACAIPWMQTVKDCAGYIAQKQGVDPDQVALAGASLGAYLALAVASQDTRYRAVVEYFGGVIDQLVHLVRRLPPVLILHGDADPLVSVDEAYKLEQLLKKLGIPYEMKIYTGQGHGFTEPDATDSIHRSIRFLDKYMRGVGTGGD